MIDSNHTMDEKDITAPSADNAAVYVAAPKVKETPKTPEAPKVRDPNRDVTTGAGKEFHSSPAVSAVQPK